MCLCLGGKKKEKNEPPQLEKPMMLSGLKIPKSTISFNAQDYEPKQFSNQSLFVQTKKITKFNDDKADRTSQYAVQAVNAKQSQLIQPKELLNYSLDSPDGVSQLAVVNTFHYSTTLNHYFLSEDLPHQISPGSGLPNRQVSFNKYENESPPDGYGVRDRNSARSQLQDRSSGIKYT